MLPKFSRRLRCDSVLLLSHIVFMLPYLCISSMLTINIPFQHKLARVVRYNICIVSHFCCIYWNIDWMWYQYQHMQLSTTFVALYFDLFLCKDLQTHIHSHKHIACIFCRTWKSETFKFWLKTDPKCWFSFHNNHSNHNHPHHHQ